MVAFLPAFISSCLLVGKLNSYVSGHIAKDEEVVLFPTMASEVNATHWEVPIHGWIYEPERRETKRRAFLSLLRKALKTSKDNQIFTRRVQWFLVDNQRWKSPRIEILGKTCRMPVSTKNGHFSGSITVSKEEAAAATDGLLSMESRAPDGRVFRGCAHLIPKEGLSVISDIDDTIKITNVINKKSMLRSTFLEDFKEVPGMAQVYKEWKRKHQACFHFVSNSPYQLYDELETFRQRCGFPAATFHLKTIRPKDKTVLNLFADPLKTKTKTISSILNRFPDRNYVLVGDSGEKDPEVYGNLARMYPRQVVGVFIRNVSNTTNDSLFRERMETAFQNVPSEKWSLFVDADEVELETKLQLQ